MRKFKEFYRKKKIEYEKKFRSINQVEVRKILSQLALKDATNEALLKLLLRKKLIDKDELYREIIKELK